MPENAGSIYSSLFLKLDQLDRGILQVQNKLTKLEKTTQAKAGGFASFWRNAFQTAFGFGIVQLIGKVTAAIRNAIGIFSGFQQSMQNVKSVTGATEEEFRQMTEAAKEAGETTRFTGRQAADALYYLGSAGFTAQQSIAALDGVLQLAGATQADLASTSEAVASIISQYSLQAEDASRVSNVFAAAIGNSQATMEKLTNSFRQVGPVAAGLGMSLEQTTGALQILYNAGFRGQAAGRALKSALADLASPTTNMQKIFTKLGVSLNSVNPATNELSDIIDVLGKSGADTADIIDAFGKIAGPQMAVLIKQGGNALRKYTQDVTDTNAATEMYRIQNDSLAGSLDFLKSKLEGVAIAIFEKLSPGMREMIDSFISFLDAAKPAGVLLGQVLNILLKIASFSVKGITNVFKTLNDIFGVSSIEMEKAAQGIDKVTESIQRAGELGNTAKKLNELTDEYEQLKSKTNLTENEQDRLKAVIMAIKNIMPDAITKFDEYGNAIEVSGEKTREAAKQMLIAREAELSKSLSLLKVSETLYKNQIRENETQAKLAKQNRNRLIAESANAEARLAILEKLRIEYNRQIDGLTGSETAADAYNKTIKLLNSDLKKVGLSFKNQVSSVYEANQQFQNINREIQKANKTYTDYAKAISKPTRAELITEEATKKLQEIADLEKQIQEIQGQIKDIEKIDPADDSAPEKLDSLSQKINEFWESFKNDLQDATRESELFGKKQDVLKAKLDFLRSSYLNLLNEGIDPASSTMQKLRQEYDLTLIELNALIENEKRHTEELQNKEKAEQDIQKMTADYYDKIQELGKSENELIEIERNRAITSVYASGASVEAIQKAIEAINLYYDKLKENSEQTKEQVKITFDDMLSYAQQLANALTGLWQAITQARLDELDRQMQAELDAAELSEETERERLERELEEAKKAGDKERAQEIENEMKRLEIKEKYEKEAAMIKYKAALQEWKFSLAAAIVSLAQGINKAVASAPWPFNLPAIAFATALGGIQVASVNQQKPKPPQFSTGGLFLGPGQQYTGNTNEPGTPAILHNREMILNEGQMKNLFNMINAGNSGGGGSRIIQVTAIIEMDGRVIGKGVEKLQNDGIIKFKVNRLIP
jgi:TP901 family phage tail tape measure protein